MAFQFYSILETVKRGDYNLIEYECDGSTLSGNTTNRGYNTKMILNTIHVLGISSKINTVIVNNRPHTDFTTFFTDKVSYSREGG